MSGGDEHLLRLLKDARDKLLSERKHRTAPLAIVGMGCRFPGGASSLDGFWRMLASGVDATSEVPPDRWDAEALYDPDPQTPGKSYAARGGFLDAIDGFDPQFFGISPREALGLDPQQRLLLEVAWEALEDAGIVPDRLRGSATGVWVGLSLDDYAGRSTASGDLTRIDPYNALGNARSLAAGRIAYVLDLHGPVMQIDASCASSLVALHLASQSLRSGECDQAIVGGVNLMSSPEPTVALCKLHALARDGRCKTFDASADGYARGEGCGIVVLKRLTDARASGDPIHAVIRGTAVNHDGRSNGLTAPNGAAQEAVIKAALANAQLAPSSVGYIEAHGTGTLLGDPIEVLALSRAYGEGRPTDQPLLIGSVKTNFGHLEGAAGIAGLIKTVLCLSHQQIAPHLHVRQLNPKLPWSELPVRVTSEAVDWLRGGAPRIAGVSAFGISGTNAHVVLEEAPEAVEAQSSPSRSAELVVLSAKTEEALRAAADRLRSHLQSHPELLLGDVAYSLVTTRSPMEQRLAMSVPTRDALLESLNAVSRGEILASEGSRVSSPKVAFVFPGQGSQWLGMGRELLSEESAFREALTACDRAIARETGWSVIEEIGASKTASRLARVEVVQPVLFALGVSLAALWRSWGVEPSALVGHSMGEVAAACVSGALSLSDCAAVICRRSRLLRRIDGRGEMALVDLPALEAQEALGSLQDRIAVAVSNSLRSTVLSGEPEAMGELLDRLQRRGVTCRRVKVDYASHSPHVDPVLGELVAALNGLRPTRSVLPMYSTLTCKVLEGPELSGQYWADNLRQPVRFAQTVQKLLSEGFTHFVEMSPHALLVGAVEELRQEAGAPGVSTGSLRREQRERQTLLDSLAKLFMHSYTLDAQRLFPAGARRVPLPTYPWQRQRFWIDAATSPRDGSRGQLGHPLLGTIVPAASTDAIYESVISATEPMWVADHSIVGQIVVPGAALAELMRAAAADCGDDSAALIEDVVFERPLLIAKGKATRIQVIVTDAGTRLTVYSRPEQATKRTAWTRHATAKLGEAPHKEQSRLDVTSARDRCSKPVDIGNLYASFAQVGLAYGPAFQGLRSLGRGHREVLGEVQLPQDLATDGYGLHPALLDAAMQAVAGLLDNDVAEQALLPFELGQFAVYQFGATSGLVHAHLLESSTADSLTADVILTDVAGEIIAHMRALHMRRANKALLGTQDAAERAADTLYRLEWRQAPAPDPSVPGSARWAVVSVGDRSNAESLVAGLRALGASCEQIDPTQLSTADAEHVACVWDARGDAPEAMRACVQALTVVQSLAARKGTPRLWWLTRGAIAVSPEEDVAVGSSSLWGLGRTVMQEHPGLRCTLLDVEPQANAAEILLREALATDDEPQAAWRAGERYVARLVRAPAPASAFLHAKEPPPIEGTVVVTGGLGALGLEVARALAERGVRHLLLASRRGMDTPDAARAVTELEALGAYVTVAAVDVADTEALARVLAALPTEWPLRGVVHAAGLVDDGVLSEQTPERFARVMSPKVLGAWNLHTLTAHADLDLFVLFSSMAGTLGSGGQGGYAAANTFLDALAQHRRARGLPGLSLAWGPWAGRGLAAALDEKLQARFARRGIGMITLTQGRALFDASLARPEAQLLVAPLDLGILAKVYAGASVPAVWRALVRTATPRTAGVTQGSWGRELAGLHQSRRAHAVTTAVRAEVARILSFATPSGVPLDKPLKELGFDSLMAVELRNALARRSGSTLPATLVFNHLTPAAIAAYLLTEVLAVEERAACGETLKALRSATARLFCFHDAGGSSTMFIPFTQLATAGVEVHAVSVTRAAEPSPARARQYIREAVNYIRSLSDRPFALLGHSLGGFFAWRILQEIAHRGLRLPTLLVPSASPFLTAGGGNLSEGDPEGAFRHVLGERANVMQNLRRDFVADVQLFQSMTQREEHALAVPIAAFVGLDDHVSSETLMRRWAHRTTREFSLTVVPGGHFYLSEEQPRQVVLDELKRRMVGHS